MASAISTPVLCALQRTCAPRAGRMVVSPALSSGAVIANCIMLKARRVSAPRLAPMRQRAHSGVGRAMSVFASASASEHAQYIEDVGATQPPKELATLINVLGAQGQTILPADGRVTGLLRWPTPPEDFNMPVVSTAGGGLSLMGRTPTEYIHRALVEEDAASGPGAVAAAAGSEGEVLYPAGDFAKSGIKRLEVYITQKVGKFPDVLEALALGHLERGDETSALVAGEWMTTGHFPGWGRPFAFNASLFVQTERAQEARDAARIALRSPWWTIGMDYSELQELAGFGDQPVSWVKERLSQEAAAADITAGKSPGQVALDQAALLMDEASSVSSDGSQWDDLRPVLAGKYREAGMEELASFIDP